jgi:hypothetical protein
MLSNTLKSLNLGLINLAKVFNLKEKILRVIISKKMIGGI